MVEPRTVSLSVSCRYIGVAVGFSNVTFTFHIRRLLSITLSLYRSNLTWPTIYFSTVSSKVYIDPQISREIQLYFSSLLYSILLYYMILCYHFVVK